MNYSFIQIKPRNSFLTMLDTTQTPRYICFSNKMDAYQCISYISKFRSRNGYFPIIDLSKSEAYLEMKTEFKKRKPHEISKYLSIETFTEKEIDRLSSRTNMKLFCIHDFSYRSNHGEDMKVLLSAQNIDSVPNTFKYIENLNYYL